MVVTILTTAFGVSFVGTVGKEDAGFDGHREDDFFDQPGFGNARGGDGGTFDKLAEQRFADAEESWESHGRMESSTDNDGMRFDIVEGCGAGYGRSGCGRFACDLLT